MKKLLKNLMENFRGKTVEHDPSQSLCPECRTPLKELSGLGALRCGKCRGIWVDLDNLSDFIWAPEEHLAGILSDTVIESRTFNPSAPRPCVKCSKPMENYLYDERDSLWVDACGHGHGIWFDPGEVALARQINKTQSSTGI